MNREQVWKNFDLGMELSLSGTFIYNGLRCFHEMRTLDHTEEIFEFFYNLAVGLERLLKIAVILLEHDGSQDQAIFEQSLITHNHLELLRRVKTHAKVAVAEPHNEFLKLLGTFYKAFRYDRYVLSSSWEPEKEKAALRGFLEKRLKIVLEDPSSIFPSQNCDRFRKYIGRLVGKISGELYRVVSERATSRNLYTYEVRSDSKAAKVFLKNDYSFVPEDILWKELLVFFMNTKATSGLLDFLRSIEPLDFDEALAADYLQCFQSEEGKQAVMDELEELYSNLEDAGQRHQLMSVIGNPNMDFDMQADLEEEPSNDGGDETEGGNTPTWP